MIGKFDGWRASALDGFPAAAVSLAAAAAAMSLLGVTSATFGPHPPFLFAFPAVAAVAMLVGFRPAVATAVMCVLWLRLPWMEATHTLRDGHAAVAALLFLVLATAVAGAVTARTSRQGPQGEPGDAPSVRGFHWLLGLAIALPWLLLATLGARSQHTVQDETERRLERIVRAAQEHATKVLDTNEMLLGRVLDLVQDMSDEQIRSREAVLHEKLTAMTTGLPQLQSIWVQDATGRPLLTNRYFPAPADRLDVSDRDFFVWHREGRGGLFISEPSVGRVTRERFFDTSRRRDSPFGEFGGIVHASLQPAYFSRYFEDLAGAEPTLTVTLLRADGTFLARFPPAPPGVTRSDPKSELMRRLGQGERSGVLRMTSSFDGRDRVVAFRALEGYPLFIGAGVEWSHVQQAWHSDMVRLSALVFPLSAALVGAAWLALLRARREHEALVRLRAEVGQRMKFEDALVRTQKLQALGQITGSVAHDFNNLLAVIRNCAHLMLHRPEGADVRPQALAIERAVHTGAQLTRQLLAVSRRQALQPMDLDLRDMLPRSAELLRSSVSGKIELELRIDPGLRSVHMDPSDLELALLNLVLNARHAMPDGGHVWIEAVNVVDGQERDVRWVDIRVRDTGCGIDPQIIDRVFEPFFTTREAVNGNGLGLSQVRSACEQAGGSVSISSRLGSGTTVTMRLPAVSHRPVTRNAAVDDEGLDLSVLVVEDDAEVAATTVALLEAHGARVALAGSAAQALAMLDAPATRFDVVLSDVAMPGDMNGIGLAHRLRRDRPKLAVVLMTGFTAELEAAVADGFVVVPKPFDPRMLVAALRRACRSRELVAG
jgi:signal transduction histidine kinase/CheY-like chemotaxis protein